MTQTDRDIVAKLTARRDQLQEVLSDAISRMHPEAVIGMHYVIMDMQNRNLVADLLREIPEGIWEQLINPLMSLGCIVAHIGAIEKGLNINDLENN